MRSAAVMSVSSTLLHASVLLTALWCSSPARAGDEAWQPARVREGVFRELRDCRSPTVRHELRIDHSMEIGRARFTFGLDNNGKARLECTVGKKRRTHFMKAGKPAIINARLFGKRYGFSARLSPERDAVWIASAYGAQFRVGKDKAYVVDSDLDGELGTAADGYVAPGARTVSPWNGEAWTSTHALRLERLSQGAWRQASIPMPHPGDVDHGAAWRMLQWRRQQCGVLPVQHDPALEPAMRLHIDYMRSNDVTGHDELPGLPNYTREGAEAGMRCVIAGRVASCLDGLFAQLDTLYHRNSVLRPSLLKSAMVFHRGAFMMDVWKHTGGFLRQAIIAYPPHGMVNVRRRFHRGGEIPMPVPDTPPGGQRLGTAIGVYGVGLENRMDELADPQLLAASERGEVIHGAFHYPFHDPGTGIGKSNHGAVALVPYESLHPNALVRCSVRVTFKAEDGGSVFTYEWEFRTGSLE